MKPTRRRAALQPATGIDRALLLDPTRRRKPRQIERKLQADIVACHAEAVVFPLSAILFAVPNGEERPPEIAAILSGRRRTHPDMPPETDAEAMTPAGLGVLPGVVDLVLLLPGARTVLIELKRPKTDTERAGALSAKQKIFCRAAKALGHDYHLLQSVAQYQALLIAHGVQIRAIAQAFNSPSWSALGAAARAKPPRP
jgi:hypothetical protein